MIDQKKEKEDTLRAAREIEVRADIRKTKRKDKKIKRRRRTKREDVDHHLTLDLDKNSNR